MTQETPKVAIGAGSGIGIAVEGKHVPPSFTNRFNVAVGSELTRIVFGEGFGAESQYHHSFYLATSDAVELARIILRLTEIGAPELLKK